ncbi:hypothetical protein FHU28_005461 [Micromonospora echinospora]|uniref:Uncharacterized protein n=1 Tax=Micromonospora echinospora TaxID=1877 RepID=A0ABR6MJP9_MICEC|nr:hypothetical protein [Micromonospora echinospora]
MQILGRDEQGGAALVEAGQFGPEVDARERVQAGGRLVQDHHCRLGDERHRQVQLAAGAAGELCHPGRPVLAQPEQVDELPGPVCSLPASEPERHAVEVEHLRRGGEGVQRVRLRRQADQAPRVPCLRHGFEAADADRARRRGAQGGDDLQQCRLAGAVVAEHDEPAARRDGEVERAQGVTCPVGLGQGGGEHERRHAHHPTDRSVGWPNPVVDPAFRG